MQLLLGVNVGGMPGAESTSAFGTVGPLFVVIAMVETIDLHRLTLI